jgi:hypothetical protein
MTYLLSGRRSGVVLTTLALMGALSLMFANTASAIEPTVPMGTAANYSVLAASTVTNTGPSVLHGSLGLSPGSSISGFAQPGGPGTVVPPAVIDRTNGAAAQARSDLTAAYLNAAGRPGATIETSDLGGLNLTEGLYSAASKGPLGLTGTLTLNGGADAVFIFQTDSTLITDSASTVSLVGGVTACNVFWQVGSSATLGTGSNFVGNILALTSVTVTSGVTVEGRALARNGAVTLDNDVFTRPLCAAGLPAPATTTTTAAPTGAPGGVTTTTIAGGTGLPGGSATTTTTLGLTVGVVGPPHTGVAPLPTHEFPWPAVLLAGTAVTATAGAIVRRRMRSLGTQR